MAETFPVTGFSRIGVRIRSGVVTARTTGGLLVTGRRHEPHWAGPFTTGPLEPAEWSALAAFLEDCVDRNLRVDFVHPRHAVPRAYTPASWPMIGDAELEAVTDLRTIVVSGLALGLNLRRGDRLSLMQGELVCHRKMAADVVVSSITAQTLALTPRIPMGIFAAGAAVRLRNPPLRLAIVPDSSRDEEVFAQTPMTFETEEALT